MATFELVSSSTISNQAFQLDKNVYHFLCFRFKRHENKQGREELPFPFAFLNQLDFSKDTSLSMLKDII